MTLHTNCMATIPDDLIVEKVAKEVRLINPRAVNITRYSESLKLDTDLTDVILSPGGIGRI